MKSKKENRTHRFYRAVYGKRMIPVILAICFAIVGNSQGLLSYVQPLSGTAPSTTISAVKHSEAGSKEQNANTIPAVGLPFGMTQWVAQTRSSETKCIPPYLYRDNRLTGFRGTHWISGSCMQDYGSVTLVPVTGHLKTKESDYAFPFLHEKETVSPDYYRVVTENITAELTSTLRCGLLRFTVHQDDSLYLLVIPNSDYGKAFIKVDASKGVIYGYNPVHRIYQGWGQPAGFSGWFYIRVERPFTTRGTFDEKGIFLTDSLQNRKGAGVYIGFKLKQGEQLQVRTGTSFSSLEGAIKNLETETGGKDFDEVRKEAGNTWESMLGKVIIETKDDRARKIFYTSFYHAVQHPRLYNDVDGHYPVFSGKQEKMNSGSRDYYDDFSMWDIYRAQLPLLELLEEKRTSDFVQSMIRKGEQGGWLPVFPCWNSYTAAMIGDHVTAFIAGAYAKGIREYDAEQAYALMRKNAFQTPADSQVYKNGMGRRALTSYLRYGFIPMEDSVPDAFHKKEQVSRTLEYAFDDYALSVMAKRLKRKKDFRLLHRRAFNYKKIFDPSSGMMRGRFTNGLWASSFHPDIRETYITEGTPRQYTFYVPQDLNGLAALMGGTGKLEDALDSLFLKQEYWHGNEPGHQIPFLYNFTASPWKTQKAVRHILDEEYSDGPGGLSGNDDAGQMSAWYMFAAMGFYPVNPVSGEYQLTVPLFDSIVIRGEGNKRFEVRTHRNGVQGGFISRVEWNNKVYDKNFITYSMIKNGGQLEIWLTDNPAEWGSKKRNRAASLSK